MSLPSETPSPAEGARRSRWTARLVLGVVFLAAVLALPLLFGNERIFEWLAGAEEKLRGLYRDYPWGTLAAAFVLYVAVTGLSIPGALPLSLTYGWLFGFLPAVILVSFASTSGATIAFLLSRWLIGQWVQERFADRLAWFNAAIEREGEFFLLALRLVPLAPFWLVNLLAGLTKIRVTTFWWVSQLGMLPGTLLFIYAGASAPSLAEIRDKGLGTLLDWNLIAALTLLGIFPLATKYALGRLRNRRSAQTGP